MAPALSLPSRSRLAFRPCDLSEKAPRLLLPLSEPWRSEATSHQLVAEITTGPRSRHVQGEKILIRLLLKGASKTGRWIWTKESVPGDGALLGVEVGRGLVAGGCGLRHSTRHSLLEQRPVSGCVPLLHASSVSERC